MFSFRQKIFITYVVLFIVFAFLTFPLVTSIVRTIAEKSMKDRTTELISKIQSAPNNEAIIRRIKDLKPLIFFRVSIITDDGRILYDSHNKNLMGPRFSQEHVIDHPEVLEAFQTGSGYMEDYSELIDQKFSYFAKAFDFHGKTYVMRTAFPYKYFADLRNDCEIAFLGLITFILLLFSAMTWFIIHRLTDPIQQIIDAVKPYQEDKQTTLPEIRLSSTSAQGDFDKLAMTLNSLSNKIQKHIDNLTAERNEKEAILESLVEGVVAVDAEMNVTYANSMAQHFLGNDLLGHSFSYAKEPKSYSLLSACQTERAPLNDNITMTIDEKTHYLDIVAAPKGINSGAILVIQDKSPHYKLLEMRKDFIANASHELKTPITIIGGYAQMLNDNPGLPEATVDEMTTKIVKNCQRMTNLIKDLLTLSDVDNIPLSRLAPCDLVALTEQCSNTIHDIYPEASINIHTEPNTTYFITADPSLIELALNNLLENAAKYSKPPAQIDITFSREGRNIKITIADKGIGIPKADLEHIFERFYTVDKAHSQKLGGSGLGLSIVQNIIQKHFGKISIASTLGEGTTFTILLPENKE